MVGLPDVRTQVRGIVLPLPTPFDGKGQVDEDLLVTMASYYIDRGVRSFFLLGSFGQGPAMDIAQRKRVLEVLVAAVGPEIVLIPQVGGVDPYTGRELAQHAAASGVRALATVGPYYYADRTAEERREHFAFMFRDLDLPVLVYNNARYQGYDITPKEFAQLREHIPAIFALKIAKGGVSDVLRYRNAVGEEVRLFAPQQNLFPGMLVGQAGTISPPMSAIVEVGLALVGAIDEGNYGEAARLQAVILEFGATMARLTEWGRGVNAEALRYIGFPVVQYPRWPTSPLQEEGRRLLHAAIDVARAAVTG